MNAFEKYRDLLFASGREYEHFESGDRYTDEPYVRCESMYMAFYHYKLFYQSSLVVEVEEGSLVQTEKKHTGAEALQLFDDKTNAQLLSEMDISDL